MFAASDNNIAVIKKNPHTFMGTKGGASSIVGYAG